MLETELIEHMESVLSCMKEYNGRTFRIKKEGQLFLLVSKETGETVTDTEDMQAAIEEMIRQERKK